MPPMWQKDHVEEFKSAQMQCITPEMEGLRQQRKLDSLRRMHQTQFYATAGPSGKLKHIMTKSNDKGVKELLTLHAFVPCQQHHPAECSCTVCEKRLLDAAEDSNELKLLGIGLEQVALEISRLRAQITPEEPKDSEKWVRLCECVKVHKRLQQQSHLDECISVFGLSG